MILPDYCLSNSSRKLLFLCSILIILFALSRSFPHPRFGSQTSHKRRFFLRHVGGYGLRSVATSSISSCSCVSLSYSIWCRSLGVGVIFRTFSIAELTDSFTTNLDVGDIHLVFNCCSPEIVGPRYRSVLLFSIRIAAGCNITRCMRKSSEVLSVHCLYMFFASSFHLESVIVDGDS